MSESEEKKRKLSEKKDMDNEMLKKKQMIY